jgi:predicted esterase
MSSFREWLELQEGGIFAKNVVNTNPSMGIHATNKTDFEKPNILWITGMNSTGGGPRFLAAAGYPIKHISTDVNWPATITGRVQRVPLLGRMMSNKAQESGAAHISDQVQKVHSELPPNWMPDIVIGSSQGGAVAIASASLFPKARFILAAPAWKIFNVKPQIPANTFILHGTKDMQVPIGDSEELAHMTGAKLIPIKGAGHNISWSAIMKVIEFLYPNKPEFPKPPKASGPLAQFDIPTNYWQMGQKTLQQ